MNKYIKLINRIFPFSYLTNTEKETLVLQAQRIEYIKGTTICKTGSTVDVDKLYLLLKGKVSVEIGSEVIGNIEAPSYFGERAILFKQARLATVVAETDVTVFMIDSDLILQLMENNLRFRYDLATILRNKQKIFESYVEFVNLLRQKRIATKMRIVQLLDAYKTLSPILHPLCKSKKIDFFALSYVVSRFPSNLSAMSQLVMGLDLPAQYKTIKNYIQLPIGKEGKRTFYNILPGRMFIILRDDITDYIDVITKLCAYAIETKKIADRLLSKSSAMLLVASYYHGTTTEKENALSKLKTLPFSSRELSKLQQIYKTDLMERLYEIASQNGEIQVQSMTSTVRYYSDASELWIEQINKLLDANFPDFLQDQNIDIHIVSSNTHSVINSLSPWVHQHAPAMVNAEQYSQLDNPSDRLYACIKQLMSEHPHLKAERLRVERKYGIVHIDNSSLTGIDVSVIDLSKLSHHIDPFLSQFTCQKKTMLFNIDYAYGKQAEPIIRNLILLFGHKIKSLSILGKAGSIVGARGSLMIPNYFIIQENDVLYPVLQCDMQPADFVQANWKREIQSGTMLTVLGTLMQNTEMLWFYRHFWNVIGMEMEGGYFLQEINRIKMLNLISPEMILRFAYYVSDTPLDASKNLANKMSLEEGLPAVYTITRVILKKILASNHEK